MTLLILYICAVVLGIVLCLTLLLTLVWWGHLRFWRGRLESKPSYAHVETLELPDGGIIELRRVSSPAQFAAPDVPVLLIHGLAMNHQNQDTAEASFARYLERQGRDVWLLTLRTGLPPLTIFGPANAHFAAMVKHDLPCGVQAVLARTGHSQLDLGVFSMGGMLLYAGLDRTLDPQLVRRVAVFASPARVRPLGLLSLSRFLPAALVPTVPMRLCMRTLAFAPRWISQLLWQRLYNAHNVERAVERRMLWNVWEDIPGRLGSDFVRWAGRGGELSVDGKPVLSGLARVSVPACFFAGARDWLAPVDTVREGYEAWGAALPNGDKHFVVLGREMGLEHDYGHCDIGVGRHVQYDVFEPAARFLATGHFQFQYVERSATGALPVSPAAQSVEISAAE